jgi:hypothetical protein
MVPMQDLLDAGSIETLVASLREIAAAHAEAHPDLTTEILKEAEHFETNASRMRYPEFRQKGLFVGSGVTEAGCRSVVGSRLKQSGRFWTVGGANAIIALRCCRINGRLEDYIVTRRAAACTGSTKNRRRLEDPRAFRVLLIAEFLGDCKPLPPFA